MAQEHHSPNVQDADLKVTKTLPGSDTTVYSDPIDLANVDSQTSFLAMCELLVTAPALATGQLGDAATMTYLIQHDDDAEFGSAETLSTAVLVQTGAGGAGAAAAKARFRLPSNVKRYVRLGATNSADVDASAASAVLALVF